MKKYLHALAMTAFCIGMFATSANASSLKVMGNDRSPIVSFDRKEIEALGLHTLKTETPWTDGVVHFEGVKLKDFLLKAGIDGQAVTATAFDDYAISISPDIIEEYDPIVASRMNGEVMTLENKGPYWIMFDFEKFTEDQTQELRTYAVWHLIEFEVE